MVDEIIKERMVRSLQEAIGYHWGCGDDDQRVLRELYLTNLKGSCLPYKYIGDDILKEIENKFYFFLGAIRDEFEPYIEIYVIPSYEDATAYLMILEDKILYKGYQKAWNFWFESEEEMMDEMYSIYRRLLVKSEKEKTFECYTLCEDDIKAVAEKMGTSLEGLDHSDMVRNIKRGVSWALDDVRDEIIEESIKMARRI